MAINWNNIVIRDPLVPRRVGLEIVRDAQGQPVRCTRCRDYWAVFEKSGLCQHCGLCGFCGLREVDWDNPKAIKYGRCSMCVCGGCGTSSIRNRLDDSNDNQAYCTPCFIKQFPDALCRHCNGRVATIITRGQTRPTVCGNCVITFTPGVFFACFFCEGVAITAWHKYAVCDYHNTRPACGENKCNPGRQCQRCGREATRAADERNDRRTQLRAVYPHAGHGVGEFDVRNCRGCLARADRGLMLPPTTPMRFWPEWPKPNEAPPVLPMSRRRHNRSSRYLGAEVEVAGALHMDNGWHVTDTVERWGGAVVRDASLGEGGFEVITAPAAGDYFVEQVREVCRALEAIGAHVDRRCGLHIHVNAKDFTYYDMRRLLMLYSRLEPALLRTQPIARTINGRYARPCGHKYATGVLELKQPKEAKKTLVNAVYGRDTVRPLRHRNGHNREVEARYDALNVQSWFYRGTIECRMHSGTVSARRILAWGALWAAIVDAAYRMTERTILSLGTDTRSSIETLMTLAPNDRVRSYLQGRLDLYGEQYDIQQDDPGDALEVRFEDEEDE